MTKDLALGFLLGLCGGWVAFGALAVWLNGRKKRYDR